MRRSDADSVLLLLLSSAICSIQSVEGSKPFFWEKAKTARWLTHSLDYGILNTLSSRSEEGKAFGNPQSFVDGPVENGTGRVYFYVSDLDASMQDVAKNNTVSLTLSEEMLGNKCSSDFWDGNDAEDPRCVRAVFTGRWRNDLQEEEKTFATNALFARHAEMKTWPVDHHWTVGTLDIERIWLIDIFGGASDIAPSDYFAVRAPDKIDEPKSKEKPNTPQPPVEQKAATARWLVHEADFGVLSTTSVHLGGAPFGNPQSFCDGPMNNGTGHVYLYVSDLDASMQDVANNPNVSFTISEEFVRDACRDASIDPEDPRCVRLVLSGTVRDVTDSDEGKQAKANLFARHPAMAKWPADHHWKIVTLDIAEIWMIDTFGGASIISLSDYYSA